MADLIQQRLKFRVLLKCWQLYNAKQEALSHGLHATLLCNGCLQRTHVALGWVHLGGSRRMLRESRESSSTSTVDVDVDGVEGVT